MTASSQSFVRDGAALHIDDSGGSGLPVIFQHGLSGDAQQTEEVFPGDRRFRRITLECRGHGASEPGDSAQFSIATFAGDVAALIDARELAPLVVGGISMGASIALRLAVRRKDIVRGLILARPAWATEAAPKNMTAAAEVGRLIATLPAQEARKKFLASDTAQAFADRAPDNLATLEGWFARKPLAITAALLQRISADGPGVSEDELRAIRVPTLMIAHGRDIFHPLTLAESLASLIPGSRLVTITAKADDRARYVSDFRAALSAFLKDFL
ncbi:MAG TPA: alpha/beta hydrolase [Terriglobia bacterium]|nr:alpha/beta hydrolase [Terriglobia bacterium]